MPGAQRPSSEAGGPDCREGSPGGTGPLPATPDLVRRAVGGEQDAFEPLVRRFSDTIVRFAYHMLGDFQVAEDIAQETFLKAFSHLRRLDEPEKFSTWLYSITRHLCLDWIRARRSTVSMHALEDDGVEVSDDRRGVPEEAVESTEMHGHVLEELQRLRPDYRDIVLMKHVYELSYKEISEAVGLSVSAVGEKLSRVRQMLRKRLCSRAGPGPRRSEPAPRADGRAG